jgi:hypothetical protein
VRAGVSLHPKLVLEGETKMDHFVSKVWPSDTLLGIAEGIVTLSVLLVVGVTVLRMLGLVAR